VHLLLVRIKLNYKCAAPSQQFFCCRTLQDLRDRTYYLSNGVIRVGGRRVATNAAAFTKGDIVGVVLDADQGEIVFLRNGIEQGRARGIRGRLYPFVSFDSEQDQITLLGELPEARSPSCHLPKCCCLLMLWGSFRVLRCQLCFVLKGNRWQTYCYVVLC
jgi:hypothetical protein